jgi:hypothetical protein
MLSNADSRIVEGLVTISGANNTEQYATLSFRQEVGSDEMIEIKSINVLNTTSYSEVLPADPYTFVASTLFGFKTEEFVIAEDTISQDVVLNTPE